MNTWIERGEGFDWKDGRNMYLLSCRALFYFCHLFLCLVGASSCLVFYYNNKTRQFPISLSLLVLPVLYFLVLSCAFLSCLPFRVVKSNSSPVEIRQCESKASFVLDKRQRQDITQNTRQNMTRQDKTNTRYISSTLPPPQRLLMLHALNDNIKIR
jgi:hypothetical protein